jgi:hypothetical protein
MSDDEPSLEAKAYRDEGDKLRKQADADLENARYERGQVEHAKRTMEQLEASISRREEALRKAGEPEFIARVAAADKALAEAKALKADYDAAKHGAARALVEINEREKAERAAAA